MNDSLFQGASRIPVIAYCVANHIETRSLRRKPYLALGPLTFSAGAHGVAVIFRFGAVVFFGTNQDEEYAVLSNIRSAFDVPIEPAAMEAVEVVIANDASMTHKVEGDRIFLRELSIHHVQIIGTVLALSVALENMETRTAKSLGSIEPIARAIREGTFGGRMARQLMQHMGDTLLERQAMLGDFEISDKPDLLWDYSEFERFHAQLLDEFEIGERHSALEQKLELISHVASSALDMIQERRALRVEWYIVCLIIFEILLTLYQMILGTH